MGGVGVVGGIADLLGDSDLSRLMAGMSLAGSGPMCQAVVAQSSVRTKKNCFHKTSRRSPKTTKLLFEKPHHYSLLLEREHVHLSVEPPGGGVFLPNHNKIHETHVNDSTEAEAVG